MFRTYGVMLATTVGMLAMVVSGCEADDSSAAAAATATEDSDAGSASDAADEAATATATVTGDITIGTSGHCVSLGLGAIVRDLPVCDPTSGHARGTAFTSQLPLLGAISFDDTGMITSAVGKTLNETSVGVNGLISTGAVDVSASSSLTGATASTSVAAVNLNVVAAALGLGVSAVSATATSACGVAVGTTSIAGLTLNGKSVAVTGAPNQVVAIPGGLLKLVLNEQVAAGPGGITVNAIHLSALSSTILGLDVIIASATAEASSVCGCPTDGGLLDLDSGLLDGLKCSADGGLDVCPLGMVCLPL